MWSIWDKKSEINGTSAEHVLATFKHLEKEETIFLKTVDDKVTNVEGKNIIAKVFGIDPALTNDEFIAAYEAKMAELEAEIPTPEEEIPEEMPEEIPEEEEDDTTTYAELAQVYAEGVNSIE